MSARSLAFRSIASFSAAALLLVACPSIIFAEEPAPQVDNSKVSFEGVINSNAVYVRSGPGENYYATQKLDKDAKVTVVGLKFEWLKVIPPEGSFSYVAKAYVEKRGDGKIGRVTKPDLNVRAGSDLNQLKTTVQAKLDQEEDVTILGEQDEYFKIKPPEGSYLYINKQFVDPVKQLPPVAVNPNKPPTDPVVSAPMVTKTPETPAKVGDANTVAAAAPSTQPGTFAGVTPSTQPSDVKEVAVAPSTQPVAPSAEAKFDTAEASFLDATNLPLDQQPIAELTSQYTALVKTDSLPVSMRRISEMRLATLKLRGDACKQYVEAKKMQEDSLAKQTALKAEQDELSQRVKDQDVTTYTALGTLRTSSLQLAGGTLYRLTDPNTGRTLLYIRSSDPKYADLLNKFIGVRGDITEDSSVSLKTIAPTVAEAVDVAKVNSTVTARIIPPTLLPKAPTASIGN